MGMVQNDKIWAFGVNLWSQNGIGEPPVGV